MLLGLDIGGTKCAVTIGEVSDDGIKITAKRRFETPHGLSRDEINKRLATRSRSSLPRGRSYRPYLGDRSTAKRE